MAENYEKFPNSKVTCPYDAAHSILVSKLFVHLQKCSIVNKHSTNLKCPFNSLHVCSSDEIMEHISECNSRNYAEMAIVQQEDAPVGYKEPPIKPLLVNEEEDWDSEMLPRSVLSEVEESQKQQCFLIPPSGKTKSERKKIRREHVEKCKQLQ